MISQSNSSDILFEFAMVDHVQVEKFPRMYKFYNGNLNAFVLLLRKGVYLYEHIDSWERFNETSLSAKKDFYSKLTLEDISDILLRNYGDIQDSRTT